MIITKPHFSDSFGFKFFKKVFFAVKNLYIFFDPPSTIRKNICPASHCQAVSMKAQRATVILEAMMVLMIAWFCDTLR